MVDWELEDSASATWRLVATFCVAFFLFNVNLNITLTVFFVQCNLQGVVLRGVACRVLSIRLSLYIGGPARSLFHKIVW